MDSNVPFDNDSDDGEIIPTRHDQLTQAELDGVDLDSLRVRLLTIHHKRQVIERLSKLEEEREQGKALYKENEELYEVIPLRQILQEEEIPESELAFFTDIMYLEDLYSSKVLRSKWT